MAALTVARSGVGGAILGFLILMALFWVLESLWPEDRAQPRWRRDSATDVLWWFLDYASRLVGSVVALAAILLVARVLPHTGIPAIRRQPAWLQGLEILFIGDLCGYWSHRLFHTHPALWRFHAVHHSPEQLDWLAAARVHPVDTITARLASMLPLYLLGFSGVGLAPYALFLAIYPIYLHANVSWGYGPLGYVISSPAFHRWHHSSEKAALDKNFSGLFPCIDLLFGTAYFPRHRSARYGLYRTSMPRGLIAQLLYPFRRRSA